MTRYLYFVKFCSRCKTLELSFLIYHIQLCLNASMRFQCLTRSLSSARMFSNMAGANSFSLTSQTPTNSVKNCRSCSYITKLVWVVTNTKAIGGKPTMRPTIAKSSQNWLPSLEIWWLPDSFSATKTRARDFTYRCSQSIKTWARDDNKQIYFHLLPHFKRSWLAASRFAKDAR